MKEVADDKLNYNGIRRNWFNRVGIGMATNTDFGIRIFGHPSERIFGYSVNICWKKMNKINFVYRTITSWILLSFLPEVQQKWLNIETALPSLIRSWFCCLFFIRCWSNIREYLFKSLIEQRNQTFFHWEGDG